MKTNKMLLFVIIALILAVSPAQAETTFDFLKLSKMIYESSDNIWTLDYGQTQKMAYSISNFSCKKEPARNEMYAGSMDVICKSDSSSFEGKYKITFAFNEFNYLRSFEIQAWHPGLDNYLANTIYGLEFLAGMARDKAEELSFFEVSNKYIGTKMVQNLLFTDENILIQSCRETDDRTIFCTGYRPQTGSSEENILAISFVEKDSID